MKRDAHENESVLGDAIDFVSIYLFQHLSMLSVGIPGHHSSWLDTDFHLRGTRKRRDCQFKDLRYKITTCKGDLMQGI